MKYIKRVILLIAVVFATTLQAQTKTFNSQVRVKQVPLSSSLDSLVTINSSGLLTYLPKSELASGGALEFITEGGNTGIAIKGRNPDNYGDIGEGAVDLSFSNSASTTKGATGNYSFAVGLNNTVGLNSLVSGGSNTAGLNSLVSGSSNVADQNSISGGLSNIALRYSLVSGRSNTVGNAAFGAGRDIFAPSYAETALGMFGTDYAPVDVDAYNANDRLFSLANGINDTSRNDALIVYKSGNAILDGDLTADKFIGDGSSITSIDKINTGGYEGTAQDLKDGIDLLNDNFKSNQLADNTTYIGSRYDLNGIEQPSNNQLGTPYIPVTEGMRGKDATISGFGNISSSTARISFRDSNNDFLSSIGETGTYTPHTFTIPNDAYFIAFSIVNELGIGSTPLDNDYTDKFMFNIGSEALAYEDFYSTDLNSHKLPTVLKYDLDEVVIIKEATDVLAIYFHNSNRLSNKWIKLYFIRAEVPAKFANVWKLDEGYTVDRVGLFEFNNELKIFHTSVWETALKVDSPTYPDASSFLGSTHGNETTEELTILLDNDLIDVSDDVRHRGKNLNIFYRANLSNPDGTGTVGTMYREYNFNSGGFILNNTYDWKSIISFNNSTFVAMLPVKRDVGDVLVTHTAFSNDTWNKQDVSSLGFTTSIYDDRNNPNRNKVVLWGDDVYVSLKSLRKSPLLSDSGMYVQNSSEIYNKVYSIYGGVIVSDGDRWEVSHEYIIGTR